MLELLSPAGSPEAVIAAVQNGADAVYMGLGIFNARRGAKNFDEEEFAKAVRYCRVRDCKVYVTMNTLVGDREMENAAELARRVSDLGASAILVQDLGLLSVLRNYKQFMVSAAIAALFLVSSIFFACEANDLSSSMRISAVAQVYVLCAMNACLAFEYILTTLFAPMQKS